MNKITRHGFLWLAVFSFGVIIVSLPRIASSTRTKPEPATTSVRQIALTTKDLIYDPVTQRIYASVPSSAGGIGNSITQIDPVAGTVGASVPIGSEPGKLAISDNSQYIYTSLDGAAAVRRFDLASQTAGLQFSLGSGTQGAFYADDISVMPGQPNSVAISRRYQGGNPTGVAIYDSGTSRPVTTSGNSGNNVIEFSSTASRLYGYYNQSSGFQFSKLAVDASGVSIVSSISSLISGFGVNMVFQNGLVYSTTGKVIDPEAGTLVGTFAGIDSGSLVLPDSSANQVYFLTGTGTTRTLKAFNQTTFLQTGSLTITGVSGTPSSLIKWGADGLAFRTSGNQVFLISTSDVVPIGVTPVPSPTQLAPGVIRLPLVSSDLVYASNSQQVYASLPSGAGSFGNSIVAIAPQTGVMAAPVFLGSEPNKLAIADTGQDVYVGLDGAASVRRFDVVSQAAGSQFALGVTSQSNGLMFVDDMAVLPGSPNSVAISRRNVGFSPRHEGVGIYDNGAVRSVTTPRHTGADVIEFSSLASTLYGYNNESTSFGLYKMAVGASGVSIVSTTQNVISKFGVDIRYDNGLLYATSGRVVNPETATIVGTFPDASGLVLPDSAMGRVYFLNGSTIKAYDSNTFLQTGTLTVPGVSGTPGSFIKWGPSGLAFRTESQVYFISTSAIADTPPVSIPVPIQVGWGVTQLSLATNDLVYDSNTQRIYATIPDSETSFGNSIAPINPLTATIDAPVFIGSEPGKLAISANKQYLYAALDGAAAVRRFDLASLTPGLQFGLGTDSTNGPYFVEDLAVMPTDPNTVAVSRRNIGFSPKHEGVGIYDNGVVRSTVTSSHTGSNAIEFSSTSSRLYGYNNETSEFGFRKMTVDASGVSVTSTTPNLIQAYNADIKYENGRVYASTREVIDPEAGTLVGTFQGNSSLAFIPDATVNRAFFVSGNGNSATLQAFNLNTLQPAGFLNIPGIIGTPKSLVRWGSDGLAFSTSGNQVFFVRTLLFANTVNFVVNFSGDAADTVAGDGVCDTSPSPGDQCTLRAAIEETNALPTDDAISFGANLSGSILTLDTALPSISGNLTITGPGASVLSVQRSFAGSTPEFRIFATNSGTTVTISGLTVSNGRTSSVNGAGISNSGTLTLNDLIVSGNSVAGGTAAGGIENLGTLTLNNCVVSGNGGIGISNSVFGSNTTVTINSSVISGNTNSGIYNRGFNSIATTVINNSTISGNSGTSGGGINNGAGSFTSRGFLTINNSTVSGNTSTAGSGGGGGIYNAAVFGNAATVVTINNSTISGNFDTSNTGGGGILSFGNSGGSATLTINNGTIVGNSSTGGNGGGIFSSNLGGPTILNLRNTIVAGNLRNSGATTSDISGAVDPAGSFNLIGDGTDMTGLSNGANGNQVGTSIALINPRLGPLANNGGPTQTHRLLASSPALDAAADVALTTLNGAIDNTQITFNVTDATSIPADVNFVVLIDSEQISVVTKAANTLSVVRGVNGTTAAAHASGAGLYPEFDQRGAGFLRKRDAADVDTVATIDIGALEAQASIENISDKSTVEDTPISFGFNVGDPGIITSVTASSDNSTLVPNSPTNLNVTGSGSTRTLNIVPAANRSGTATITVTVNTTSESISDTFVLTVTPVADTPSVTNATTNEDTQTLSGLVITRNAADFAEVSHFKITGITNGTLFQHNGITPINNGDFILAAEGSAGLRFTPAADFFGMGSFSVQASVGNTNAGLGGGVVTASITVNAVSDVPTVTNATTTINTQTTSGLVITKNAVDGTETTHFRIENIQNGTLFKNDGVTQINNFAFITVAEGAAGLKFTPALNLFSPGTTFSFQVRGATSASGNGLGAAATATITVNCNASSEVTNTTDSGAGSLREAILNACPGATITFNIPTSDPGFSGGVYTITLTSGELIIARNLSINGLGASVLKVQRSTAGGTANFRVFRINSGTTVAISGLTVSNGRTADGVPAPVFGNPGDHGGGIYNAGTLTLTDDVITGNTTGKGAAASAPAGDGVSFGGSGGAGGGIYNSGSLTMTNVTVSNNTTGTGATDYYGGGGGSGAGIYLNSGTLAITSGVVTGNATGRGAIGTTGGFSSGSGGSGAGIYISSGTAQITDVVVSNNTTESTDVAGPSNSGSGGVGGGIGIEKGNISITNSTISGNHTGDAAGQFGQGGFGAGIFYSDGLHTGSLTITNTTISGNVTGGQSSSTFSEAGVGGGMYNSGILNLTNTTITGNSTGGYGGSGGGLWNAGPARLTNCTIAFNAALHTFGGAGIHQFNSSSAITIHNTIVAHNSLAGNPNGTDLDGNVPFNSLGHNLIRNADGSSGFNASDQLGTALAPLDPKLGPLANNGGPTMTHALLLNSPALDAGDSCVFDDTCVPAYGSSLTNDQRGAGFSRKVDGPDADATDTVDVGAYEAQVSVADIADQTINEDGSLSLPFNVGGAANITSVTASSSNTTLVPNNAANISVSGSGSTRTLTVNPAANAFGTSTITVTVNGNNSQTMTDTFVLTVNSANDAPSFMKGVDQTVSENSGGQTVNNWATNIAAGPADEGGQTVNFVVVNNSNASLFATAPAVSSSGTLSYTPATGASGTALITIALMDNGGTADGGANTSATQSFNITVQDGGALQFNSAAFSRAEPGGNAVITVTRSGGSAGEARVDYATANGTATDGQDYTGASGTLIFANGITTQTFNIAITNDAVDESDETVNLTLTNASGSGSLGTPAAAVLTIADNEPTPGLSIDNTAVNEGNSGTATATFTVTLSGPSSQTVTVNFATANGTATAGSDYVARSGTLTFLPLETTKTIPVTVNGDIVFEPNETFVVNLTNPVNATINESQGGAQITNDDAQGGFIAFSQSLYTIAEGGGFITITVNRTNDLSGAATVDYFTRDYADSATIASCNTVGDFASSRCDYTSASGTLRFAAGETTKTFIILISQDSFEEDPESLSLTLTSPTGGALIGNPPTATLTIIDDATEPATNPIDSADAFVRQHYHDFLNREPDAAGLAFWSNQITECQQPGATCSAEVRRINVSAAFFLSIEFQETGYLAYRFYKSAYGNLPGTPVPLRFSEFLPDTQQLGKDVVIGQPGADQQLEANKVAYALAFVSRSRFTTAFPTTFTPAQFVDTLFTNAGVTPSTADRDAAINEFGGAGNTADAAARARALRRVAENSTLKIQETNKAFVLMQYFGYLRRNPNDPPEANLDFGGYNFWLGKLNEFNGNFVNAEMVKAFIVSAEYRQRFGP